MNLPFLIRTVRWLVWDTVRQSVHAKLFWVMLAVSAVCTAVCASVEVTGDMNPVRRDLGEIPAYLPPSEVKRIGEEKVKADGVRQATGEVSVGFGLLKFPLGKNREDAVRHLQIWLAAALADTAGVLLALLWTAGFLPTFLEPQSASVMLAKPAPRWAVLFGKYLGVILFVAGHAAVFVAGTWLALGLKTGVWTGTYWLAVPLLAFNFGVFYTVSAFLAVWTRNSVACVFGTLLFWLLCWAMNFAHLRLAVSPIDGMAAGGSLLLDLGYWVLPKPIDLGGIFYDAMQATGFSKPVPELVAYQESGRFRPELSVLSSGLFGVVVLALSAWEFRQTDY